jgi:type I restriction enzyme R subunit
MADESNINKNHQTELLFLDKKAFVGIHRNSLPHWNQNGKVQFVTFRLADSLPQSKLSELSRLKQEWLEKHPLPWSEEDVAEHERFILIKINKWLDAGYGSCMLSNPDIRKCVYEAMRYYDGIQYKLWAFVIMPNHVHFLASPIGSFIINKTVGGIKRYSSTYINRKLGHKGGVWQKEVFDRIVRNGENFDAFLRYIIKNPIGLPKDTFSVYITDDTPCEKKI